MTTQNNQPRQAISCALQAEIFNHHYDLMHFGRGNFHEEDALYLDEYLELCVEPEYRKTVFEVDGFLHAIAVGPTTLVPEHWLSNILGHKFFQPKMDSTASRFDNIVELLIRTVNRIVAGQMIKPQVFRVTWGVVIDEHNGLLYDDAVEWARGFVSGMRLCWEDWLPLLRSPKGNELLRPIAFLGEKGCHADQDKLTCTVAMRSELANDIFPSITGIYNHTDAEWTPSDLMLG